MTNTKGNVPRYVLLDGKKRLGPKMALTIPERTNDVIFGFADRASYLRFCACCDLPLTPYPLVKDYLTSQVSESGDTRRLIAIDPQAPDESCFNAVTVNAVLEAVNRQEERIDIMFHLTLAQDSQSYRLECASDAVEVTPVT